MTATPERAQSIDFSEPYLKTGLCLLVSAKLTAERRITAPAAGVLALGALAGAAVAVGFTRPLY